MKRQEEKEFVDCCEMWCLVARALKIFLWQKASAADESRLLFYFFLLLFLFQPKRIG